MSVWIFHVEAEIPNLGVAGETLRNDRGMGNLGKRKKKPLAVRPAKHGTVCAAHTLWLAFFFRLCARLGALLSSSFYTHLLPPPVRNLSSLLIRSL